MKQTIEQTSIVETPDASLSVSLQSEVLTDGSQVYNVIAALFDIRQPYTTYLENHNSCNKRQATAKYNRLVKALEGFELVKHS